MSDISSPPGYLPTPRTTSSAAATQTSSASQRVGEGNKFMCVKSSVLEDVVIPLPQQSGPYANRKYRYIYTFISTLFILLCIALLVLVRALIHRRRLDAAFHLANADSDSQQQQQQQQQQAARR